MVGADAVVEVARMPFADNRGVRIHYEVEGDGPPLVLQHGFACTIDNWRRPAYVDALRSDYRLILVDPRGHGDSDKPHDPQAYRMSTMVGDVTAVLDDLRVERSHYLGYSMGGMIGFGLASLAPERLASLIVGGAHPYGADPRKPSPVSDGWVPLLKQGARSWLDAVVAPEHRHWFAPERMDTEALIALRSLREHVGLADNLSTLETPCLVFVGENDLAHDDARKAARAMPNATFVTIPGSDHVEAIVRIELVLQHVRHFLEEVKTAPAIQSDCTQGSSSR